MDDRATETSIALSLTSASEKDDGSLSAAKEVDNVASIAGNESCPTQQKGNKKRPRQEDDVSRERSSAKVGASAGTSSKKKRKNEAARSIA